MDRQMDGWMDGWTDGWMDGWMDTEIDNNGIHPLGRWNAVMNLATTHISCCHATVYRPTNPPPLRNLVCVTSKGKYSEDICWCVCL
jgi:hypothetical protein